MGFMKGVLIFGAGVYIGAFIDQHYQVPKVDNPRDLLEKLNEFLEKYKKDP